MRRPGLATLVLVAVLSVSALGTASAAHMERLIDARVGPNRLSVDPRLLSLAKPLRYEVDAEGRRWPIGGLEDLELVDYAGRVVPYLLLFPAREHSRFEAFRAEPLPITKEESGFLLDLGRELVIDSIRLPRWPGPFVKRFWLQVEDSRAGGSDRWRVIVKEGSVFWLPEDGLERLSVDFAPTRVRRLRWVWDDSVTPRAPHPPAVEVRATRSAGTDPAFDPGPLPLPFTALPRRGTTSRFRLDLPGPDLPGVAVSLSVDAARVHRSARIVTSRRGNGFIETVALGSTVLRKTSWEGVEAESLEIPLRGSLGRHLELLIEDGDQTPLSLRDAYLRLAPLPVLYFEASSSPLRARLNPTRRPFGSNDLEADRARIERSETAWANWRGETAATEPPPPVSDLAAAGPQSPLDENGFAFSRAVTASRGLTSLPLDAHAVAWSDRGSSLRLLDAQHRQIPFLTERRDERDRVLLRPEATPSTDGAFTRWSIQPPEPRQEGVSLALTTSARVFERRVLLRRLEPSSRTLQTIAAATWSHRSADEPAAELELSIPGSAGESWQLEIEQGDNSPLPLDHVALLTPTAGIRYFGTGSPLRLLYRRDDLAAPRYDLEILADQFADVAALDASLGPVVAVAEQAAQPLRRLFWIVVILAAVALCGLFVRLLREPTSPTSQAP